VIAPQQAALSLADVLQADEKVIWAAHPDARSVLRTKSVTWWVGVPLTIAVIGLVMSGKASSAVLVPLGMVAFALMAAPLVQCGFDAMDDELEILETGHGSGHLYFASGWSTKNRDTDHTGKLAFRDVGRVYDVAKVLEKARR
jgi:hypothetical protein